MIRARHLKVGYNFLRGYLKKIHPYEVTAQLWNTCDSKCVYCRCPEVKTYLMSTDQWSEIIRKFGNLGTLRIKFQGGEPTLRPDFRELCKESKKAGLITAVITNGLTVSSKPELLDYLDELVVSLDSVRPEVNDYLRGEGSHEKATKAIDLSIQRGLRTYVNMALCQLNLPDLESMLQFCESRGIKMNAQPIKFGVKYYDEEARKLALTPEQIRSVHLSLANWAKQRRGVMFSRLSYSKTLSWPDLAVNSVQSDGHSKCAAGNFFVHVDPNGDIIPCIPNCSNLIPKNILKDGLTAALSHARYHNCGDCWSAYLNERNHLYRLHPSALLGFLRRG